MRLVLTSGGISNKSILEGIRKLIDKDLNGVKLLFCITASAYDGGGMNDWLIEDLKMLDSLGFLIDVCDINGIPEEKVFERFNAADVLYFEGGNTQWLRESIRKSSLEEIIRPLLETKIWIGASAGSCVLCPTISNSCQDLYEEDIEGYPRDGLGLVDFQFMPHLNNPMCPNIIKDKIINSSKNLNRNDGRKVYALDDNSALFYEDGDISIISEGNWFVVGVSDL